MQHSVALYSSCVDIKFLLLIIRYIHIDVFWEVNITLTKSVDTAVVIKAYGPLTNIPQNNIRTMYMKIETHERTAWYYIVCVCTVYILHTQYSYEERNT